MKCSLGISNFLEEISSLSYSVVFLYLPCEVKSEVKSLSRFRLFVIPWTVVYQASLSLGFSRQEYWNGCHFLLQGIFLTQGSNPGLLHCRQILYHLSHLRIEEDVFMIRHSGILCTAVPDNVLHFQLKVEAHRVTLTCVSMSMSESPDLRFVIFP